MSHVGAYISLSLLAGAATVYYAYSLERHFYPTMVFLFNKGLTALVMYNVVLAVVVSFGMVVKKVLVGTLTQLEIETLFEKAWYALTESLLALTIFRDELNVNFLSLFCALLFVKVFHWMAQFRVDQLEQSPYTPLRYHVRLLLLTFLFLFVDLSAAAASVRSIIDKGPSSSLLFAFEYGILAMTMITTLCKYVLHVVELSHAHQARLQRQSERQQQTTEGQQQQAEGSEARPEEHEEELEVERGITWEAKGFWNFLVEIVSSFVMMVLYILFFLVILHYYGMPIHIIRDVYVVVKNFVTRLSGFCRYRRIIREMGRRFRQIDRETIVREGGDTVCIICREEMERAMVLPCNHMFHTHCLRSWLERQQNCPLCRADVERPAQPQRQAPLPDAAQAPQGPAAAPMAGEGAAAAPQRAARGEGAVPEPQRPPFPPIPGLAQAPPFAGGQFPFFRGAAAIGAGAGAPQPQPQRAREGEREGEGERRDSGGEGREERMGRQERAGEEEGSRRQQQPPPFPLPPFVVPSNAAAAASQRREGAAVPPSLFFPSSSSAAATSPRTQFVPPFPSMNAFPAFGAPPFPVAASPRDTPSPLSEEGRRKVAERYAEFLRFYASAIEEELAREADGRQRES